MATSPYAEHGGMLKAGPAAGLAFAPPLTHPRPSRPRGAAAREAPALRDHLAAFIAGHEHGPLFRGPGGRVLTPRQVQRRLSQWLWKAGIQTPASPHSLRHSFAMRIYENSRDVLLVQAALGHASPASSAVYTKASQERLRAVMGELEPATHRPDVKPNVNA